MPRLDDAPRPCEIKHSGKRQLPEERCEYLNEDWITLVAETPDNDLRAHRIAMSYRHFGLELDTLMNDKTSMEERVRRIQPPPVCNANWFNFATWGTLTVTQNIGNERAPQRLNSGLAAPLRRRLTPAILRTKAADGQQVGRALAWAQRLVFVSTASALLHLAKRVAGETDKPLATSDEAKLIRALSKSSIPPSRTTETPPDVDVHWFKEDRHMAGLARAFDFFDCARRADGATRDRLVFGANVLVTAVEQDLLDPALSFVVGLVPQRVGQAVDWRVAKLIERWRGLPPEFAFTTMQLAPRGKRTVADLAWSRFMTDQVLVMALPTETLRVGRDVPPWRRDQPYFPVELTNLKPKKDEAFGAELTEIHRHVESLDRTVGNGRGSAARDWRRWDERLNWAITLLRSRQHDESLFWQPYSIADEARIARGELPHRSGDPSVLEVQPPLDPAIFARAHLMGEEQ
jgi:hypothetical protein